MSSIHDLTTLARVKTWGQITSSTDDATLSSLISATSSKIYSYLDRGDLLPRTYTEIRDGQYPSCEILLRHWPVVSITSVSVDGVTVSAGSSVSGYAPGWVLAQVEQSPPGKPASILLQGVFSGRYKQGTQIIYRAGYQITDEAATIPASPFKIISAQPYGNWAGDVSVKYASGVSLTKVPSSPSAGQYAVAAGEYTFSSADTGLAVLLSYGYVPYDLEQACIDWVVERYKYRSRIGERSKTLGAQETIRFFNRNIPEHVEEALTRYRSVVDFR